MSLVDAIIILENHQKWRLGDDDMPFVESKTLTEAIEVILFNIKKQ